MRRGHISRRLAAGLITAIAALAIYPLAADALLPSAAWVFRTEQFDSPPKQVALSSLPQVTREYDVLLRGRSQPTRISLTGVPLVEFLKSRGDVDVTKVPFVKLRFGENSSDASIALIPLTGVEDGSPPPMVLNQGMKPGIGVWPTPAVVPGQPGSRPITEGSIFPFDRRAGLSVVPAIEGAQILAVRIEKKRKKNGEWLLTARVVNPQGGPLVYRWYGSGAIGQSGMKKRFATTDATIGKQKRTVNVVVSSPETGSIGAGSFSYRSRVSLSR